MSGATTAMRPTDAGVDLSFRIGQRVRHQDYKGKRVTGVVKSLSIDSDRGLMVSIALDAPIVIEVGESRPIDIWNQTAPAHEFVPFDERDEVIAALLAALQPFVRFNSSAETTTLVVFSADITAARAAIAKTEAAR